MSLVSPRLSALEGIDSNALDTFWSEIESTGTPLIEPNEADPDTRLVTFIWRETEPTLSVMLRESFSWTPPEKRQLTKIAETDIWSLTWRISTALRSTYEFHVQTVDGETVMHPDPYNHQLQQPEWSPPAEKPAMQSVLVMPEAEELPWHEERGDVPAGTITDHTFASKILDNERPIWVYEPRGRNRDAEPLGFIVIFDGERHHSATTVLDNLIDAGEIPPLAAILVNQLDIRNQELTCNPEFSRFLVEELLPWARDAYNLTDDPERTIISGCSFGGLCSAFSALKHSDVFGNVLMQSGSCWYYPAVAKFFGAPPPTDEEIVYGLASDTPTLLALYKESPHVPVRIYQECGALEFGPPPSKPQQIHANRHFRDILLGKGYDLDYSEYSGGHDRAWWRGRLATGLLSLTRRW